MAGADGAGRLPVIDVALLTSGDPAAMTAAAGQIQAACRDRGFFYVTGHGVPPDLLADLAAASAQFFGLPLADKLEIGMQHGGRAWRGYFPVGTELTAGQPDLKEGLYFGAELPADDPRVAAGLPLHGRNLFPRQVPRLRPLVLAYLDALTATGQAVLTGVALSLGWRPATSRPAALQIRQSCSGSSTTRRPRPGTRAGASASTPTTAC